MEKVAQKQQTMQSDTRRNFSKHPRTLYYPSYRFLYYLQCSLSSTLLGKQIACLQLCKGLESKPSDTTTTTCSRTHPESRPVCTQSKMSVVNVQPLESAGGWKKETLNAITNQQKYMSQKPKHCSVLHGTLIFKNIGQVCIK